MKEKKNNKKKWMVIIVAGIIVFSMVMSIFAVVLDNMDQAIPNYNKHSFVSTDNGYKTKINGAYMNFYNYPGDLENIPLSTDIASKLKKGQGIGIIFNPEEEIQDNLQYIDVVRYELQLEIDKPVYFGITKNTTQTDLSVATKYSLPVVECDSATAEFPLILINISMNTSFIISDTNPNCIIMNAKLRNILAAKDRLLYTYYGVMN